MEKFTEKIITRDDLLLFWKEIEKMERSIFKKGGIAKISDELISTKLKEYFLELTGSRQIAFLNELKKYLQELPQTKMEIAFSPGREFIFRLADWFKKEINRRIILDLVVNPGIGGGIIIEYAGKYYDFSLARKIDELINGKKL